MKKLTTISLFIFWAAVTAILTAGLVFYQNNNLKNTGLNSTGGNSGATSSGSPAGKTTILNLAEIAKHNSLSDCWMIINNKVYNVTSYLSAHPGGAGTMAPYCGQEATRAFDTKDRNRPHSGYAGSLLANYYIGDLNQTVTQGQIQQKTQIINSTPLPAGNGGGRGDGGGGFDD